MEFKEAVLARKRTIFNYYKKVSRINRQSPIRDSDSILSNSYIPIDLPLFKELSRQKNIIVLDTRDNCFYKMKHIPRTLNMPLSNLFGSFAGDILEQKKIIVVAKQPFIEESILWLSRIGIDNVIGFLVNGNENYDLNYRKSTVVKFNDFSRLIK